MSDSRGRVSIAAVFFVVACILAAAVTPAAVATGLEPIGDTGVAGDASGDEMEASSTITDQATASSVSHPAAAAEGSQTDRNAIGPGLNSMNGTVEVVVRFKDTARIEQSRAGGSGGLSTADLKTNADGAQAEFDRFAVGNGAISIERSFWIANAKLVTVDTDRVPIDRLLQVPGVERVHENFRVELDSAATGAGSAASGSTAGSLASPEPTAQTVSTTSTDATYGVDMVRAPEVWEKFGTRGEGATVAVIDTGIDPDHPDLTVSGWAEIDENGKVIQNDDGPYDLNGHGTHVAGTVAGGNASGTAVGVAPNTTVHAIKVFPADDRSTTFTRIIGGMEASLDESVVGEQTDIIQMSLGADGYGTDLIEPVRNARDAGVIVVASAGNSGEGTSSTPGNVYDSLAVGAVDSSRSVASFSAGENVTTADAWGSDAPSDWPDEYVVPDVTAPGVDVYSAELGSTYETKSGTSMAAPHVSGVAALMISASTRNVSDDELYDTLRETANHPADATDPDTRNGTGIVDGFAAVSAITEPRSNLTVTNFEAPTGTAPGATIETTATINNTGLDPGSGTVEYRFNGTTGNETTVSLDPGEETTVAFEYVVPTDTPTNVTYEHGVYTNDSNATANIDIVDTPFYEVTTVSAPTVVERNASLEATANVTNWGDVAGDNRTVDLRLTDPENESDTQTLDQVNVSLDSQNATSVTLNGTVPDTFGTGVTTLLIASPDDKTSTTIRVAATVGTVNGTVTDAETDATLTDMDVVVRNGTEIVGETTTDAGGTYAVDVPATELNVTASNATYAPANATVQLSGSGDTATANLSLSLRNGTLAGVVGATDGLDGPTDATVTVKNESDAVIATKAATTNGSYDIALQPGTYNLSANATNFDPTAAADVAIEPNRTTSRSFELDPRPATLSGTVTAAATGDPVSDATVTAGKVSNTTDSGGTYSFDVDRGEYPATASADGYADGTQTVSLTANGSTTVNFSLQLPPEFGITAFTGPSEVERGASGAFNATIENTGGSSGDVTVSLDISPSGSSQSRTFSSVPVGENRTTIFSIAVADDAATGEYDATASTPHDTRTRSFSVVSGETESDDTTSSGGGGGGGGGGVSAPTTNEPTEPENATTNETEDQPRDDQDPIEDTPADDTDDTDDDGSGGSDTASGASDDGSGTGDGTGDSPNEEGGGGPETTDDGVPGFGAALTVIALLAAALLARRDE